MVRLQAGGCPSADRKSWFRISFTTVCSWWHLLCLTKPARCTRWQFLGCNCSLQFFIKGALTCKISLEVDSLSYWHQHSKVEAVGSMAEVMPTKKYRAQTREAAGHHWAHWLWEVKPRSAAIQQDTFWDKWIFFLPTDSTQGHSQVQLVKVYPGN